MATAVAYSQINTSGSIPKVEAVADAAGNLHVPHTYRTRRPAHDAGRQADRESGRRKNIAKRSAGLIRAGGTLVTIAGPTEARPSNGLTIDFVVVPDRAQLNEIVERGRDGRLRTNIGSVAALDDAVAAFNPTKRIKGKTIIRVHR